MFNQPWDATRPTILTVPGGYLEPVRKHVKRQWMARRTYHRRIQKKWLRRFGSRWVETLTPGVVLYDKLSNTIMCRPQDEAAIRRMVASD